jgi:membrane-bound lytic murein transglycosylase D
LDQGLRREASVRQFIHQTGSNFVRARCGMAAVVMLAILSMAAPYAARSAELFPRPASLEPAVRFWTRVYTEVDTQQGFIHDSVHLNVVYETINVPRRLSSSQRRRTIERATKSYRAVLTKLGSGARSNLNDEERRVLALWPDDVSNAELKNAATRLRFQLGQADRFRAGVVRSGTWKPYIYKVLDERRLPRELAALPHVESSFDPTAYSKVGAAGMWQFTRSTGLRYMRIDHIVDERRDPFFSTDAAARLLKDNYDVLQSWPLALTAYNHGLGGMRRAAAQQKTKDMGVIIANYQSRSFGFASRNFYTAFLAALDVEQNVAKYFGSLRLNAEADSVLTDVPDYMSASTLAQALGVRTSELRELNPALLETVWSDDKFVPKGFTLRVPSPAGATAATLLAAVPATERYAAQRPNVQHRIRQGDTLSQIAQEYRVSLAALMRVNNLRSTDLIRAGRLLNLPVAAQGVPPTLAARAGSDAVLEDGTYLVRRGDSIERIAASFNVDPQQLLSENRIRNRNLIYAGQALRIPGAAARETGPEAVLAAADAVVDPIPERRRELVVAEADASGSDDEAVLTTVAFTEGPDPQRPARRESLDDLVAAAARSVAEEQRELGAALPIDMPAGAEQPSNDLLDSIETNAEQSSDLAASLDSNVLASVQASLAADPSDYSVGSADTIQVQSLETLGHYADWLELRTQALRDLNRMPFKQAVVIGQTLKLDFSRVDRARFEQRRLAYQQQRQEAFFTSFQIGDVEEHIVRRGESLWLLAQRTYNVPVWLLRQYNPDLDLDRVKPGVVVKFPRLRPISG